MRSRTHTCPSRATTSLLALATVMVVGASPAAAQSFQGTGTIVTNTGGAADISTGANTTTITVNPGQTVIDWTPTDNAIGNFGAIGFQYDGTTATFQSASDFAVLNRINVADPTRTISMDGDIISQIVTGNGNITGGSIYFYSPSGFVIGANATINVGSLVLTASPVSVDGNGLFITGPNNTVVFGQAGNTAAGINIVGPQGLSPGASITASNYVAMVAPSITHSGSISTSNQAALVAAEATTISFSPDGLFDIQVDSGTTDSAGITVTGTGSIGGPQGDGQNSDHNRIYLVAVPKNQAMTMAIQSGADLGFDIAGAADVVGNAIVLSAGYNVVDGQVDNSAPFVNGNQANISVTNATVTSDFTAVANRFVQINAIGAFTSNYASNVTVEATQLASVASFLSGAVLNIAGDVSISADVDLSATPNASAIAGSASLLAQNGGDLNVLGDVVVTANAYGGINTTSGGLGGSGIGGSASVIAQNGTTPGSDVTIGGSVTVEANGYGGASNALGSGTGGLGRGGTATITSSGGGTSLLIGGDVVANADGFGGASTEAATQTCTLCIGGVAYGGTAQISADALSGVTSLTVNGHTFLSASATGGNGDGSGGAAFGGGSPPSGTAGAVATVGNGATMNLVGGLSGYAEAEGGDGAAANGGDALGGRARSGTTDTATSGNLTIGGLTEMNVSGRGGFGGGGNGGIGRGGQTDNGGRAGTINYGDVTLIADGIGGNAGNGAGGAGFGGNGWVDAFGAVVNVAGDYFGYANGTGGSGLAGGYAQGGRMTAAASSNDLTIQGDVQLYAEASGGLGNDGAGGDALGGTADIYADNGNTLTINGSSVFLWTDAVGGNTFSFISRAGHGTGGLSLIGTYATGGIQGAIIDIAGSVNLDSSGFGGNEGEGAILAAGNGSGGSSRIVASTGLVDIDGGAILIANGTGGGASFSPGGAGTGGRTDVNASVGTVDLGSTLSMAAIGTGGGSFDGQGGDGLGGVNVIDATNNGDVLIAGALEMNGSAVGGNGAIGGDAIGRWTGNANETDPTAVVIIARNGGAITVGGAATLIANAVGGDGLNGAGGNAEGGEVDILAQIGTVDLANVSIDIGADGGDGGQGGAGGNALGGKLDFSVAFLGQPTNGDLIADAVLVDSEAYGGNGGAGISGGNGGAGGAGGTATGGEVFFVGSAAGLDVNVGDVTLLLAAYGGAGGAGGVGGNGVGGTGGAGGNAIGGFVQVGTISSNAVPSAGGAFNTGDILIDTSALAGDGGDGGFGSNGNGVGGNGGNAEGGASLFTLRGVTSVVGDIALFANANGGDGGDGSTAGNGGDATTGRIVAESKDRFGFPAQRGILTAGDIFGQAIATAGTGAINGSLASVGGSNVNIFNGDATIGSVNFTIIGGAPAGLADFIHVADGTGMVSGNFSFFTTNELALYASNGLLTVTGNMDLTAANFIPSTLEPTATPGTFRANGFDITTGNNFYTVANLDSTGAGVDLVIDAPGAITAANINSAGAALLSAQNGDLTTGDITAADDISISARDVSLGNVLAGNAISLNATVGNLDALDVQSTNASIQTFSAGTTNLGALSAATSIDLVANAGPITAGNAVAGTTLAVTSNGNLNLGDLLAGTMLDLGSNGNIVAGDLTSNGGLEVTSLGTTSLGDILVADSLYVGAILDLTFGDMTAGEVARFGSDGSIIAGNIAAGDSVIGTAIGNITVGALAAGQTNPSTNPGALYEVVMVAGGIITTGNIAAEGEVQLAGLSGIDAGNIDTPSRLFAISDGSITLGNLNVAGQLLIGGWDMLAFTGDLRAAFDASPTFDSSPVTVAGNIVLGDISSDTFEVYAGADLTFGDLASTGDIDLLINGNLTTGDLAADGYVRLEAGGNLQTGNIDSGSYIVLFAGGDITTDALAADEYVTIIADGDVVTGNIAAGLAPPILIDAIGTTDFDQGSPIEIFGANISTGNLATDGYIGLYTQGNLTTGSVAADHEILALVGNDASFGAISGGEGFYLAGFGNVDAMTDPELGFNPAAFFDIGVPLSTAGDAAFNGAVDVAEFRSFVGGDTSLGALSSATIALISSGGLVTVSGTVSAPGYIGIESSDLEITSGGSISTAALDLHSINPDGAFLGDGLNAQSGYRLSQAEFDRIDVSELAFFFGTESGDGINATIGDLALDFLGSESSEPLSIGSWDEESGLLRIIGDVTIRVGAEQYVDFESETLALDAATGSLSIVDGQGALSGILNLEAANIFVASGTIIDKLLVDPRYAGYVEELNAPAAVQRPEGVLRAAAIEFGEDGSDVANLLIQNTGTIDTPAGFVVSSGNLGSDGEEETLLPGSINLVINGQIVTPTGTLTGIAVRDQLVAEFGVEPFIEGSTINGCPLTGNCGGGFVEEVSPLVNITPTQVALLGSDPLGEGPFVNDLDIDDGIEGAAAAEGSPIAPPQPLFDSRPLTDDGLIDDPISGAGNPSLYGPKSDEDDEDEEEGKSGDGEAKTKTGDSQ